jgi:hypothetical protein
VEHIQCVNSMPRVAVCACMSWVSKEHKRPHRARCHVTARPWLAPLTTRPLQPHQDVLGAQQQHSSCCVQILPEHAVLRRGAGRVCNCSATAVVPLAQQLARPNVNGGNMATNRRRLHTSSRQGWLRSRRAY